jgi:hypothetical protein
VFAVTTYATVSAMFWFVGLIPDLATLRDRARSKTWKIVYGMAALGWRGSAKHWHNYETAYLLLAGLATPLVVSVHTVVSFDFATGIVPGWHATIFPPYFVAGAIYAGFAMVLTLAIPLRKFYGLEDFITMKHLENMAKVMLATGLIVAYGYMMEAFFAWYSGNLYETYMIRNRMLGPYWWAVLGAHPLQRGSLRTRCWSKRCAPTCPSSSSCPLVVSVGMWLERFVIIVTSLHRDFLPSSWGMYAGRGTTGRPSSGPIGSSCTLIFLFPVRIPATPSSIYRADAHDPVSDATARLGERILSIEARRKMIYLRLAGPSSTRRARSWRPAQAGAVTGAGFSEGGRPIRRIRSRRSRGPATFSLTPSLPRFCWSWSSAGSWVVWSVSACEYWGRRSSSTTRNIGSGRPAQQAGPPSSSCLPYETTILVRGGRTAVLGYGLALRHGLAEPVTDPVFNVLPSFVPGLPVRDRFFHCIEATDPEVRPPGDAQLSVASLGCERRFIRRWMEHVERRGQRGTPLPRPRGRRPLCGLVTGLSPGQCTLPASPTSRWPRTRVLSRPSVAATDRLE